MEPKRNRIIAATGFAVALLILGGNVAVICAMGGERGQLEGEYFTPDAAGLDIPASSIAPQPLPETEFTGFPVSTGRRVATCAVSTGLEASWVLDYTLTDDGWRCAAVKGPLEGGYRVHEGKPEEQK